MDTDTPPEPTDLPIDHPLRQAWLLAFATDDGGSPSYGLSVANPGAFRGVGPTIVLRPETAFETLIESIIDAVWGSVDADSVLNRAEAFESVAAILRNIPE